MKAMLPMNVSVYKRSQNTGPAMNTILRAALFAVLLILLLPARSRAENTPVADEVPDDVELAVLKLFYDSLAGSGWTNKTNWPAAGSWPSSATSALFGTWFGVVVVNGDIAKWRCPVIS